MSTGPTATGPGAPGPVRRVHLRIVLVEPVDTPEPFTGDAGRAFDAVVADSVRAVLVDNGYAVEEPEVVPAATLPDGPPPGMVEGWPIHARQLDMLLAEVATARRRAAVAYAEAFLAAEGTQQARAATAELAAAGPREELETLEGRAEAFRMVLAADARTDALTAALSVFGAGGRKGSPRVAIDRSGNYPPKTIP